MRDAFGGIVNITMIVVFLVVVSGYLAFNVTYTKAFRMKNKIITTLEQYEGNCEVGSVCYNSIEEYANSIGYNLDVNDATPSTGGVCSKKGYCFIKQNASNSGGINDNNKIYFKVTTKIVIQIPIINKVMENMDAFTLSGNTKLITVYE